jgi:predicted nucleic acid-binding protein
MEGLKVLLDSTAFVDVLRRVPAARDFLHGLDQQPLASEVTRTEVIRGLRSGERTAAEALFGQVEWVRIDEPIARLAGDMGRRYVRSHRGIGVADLLVAATAHHVGALLVTSNVKHFPMFPELTSPY